MENQNETTQPVKPIEIDPITGKKLMPSDKRGLENSLFALVDHEGNVKLPKEVLERAGIELPPNEEWITEVEIGGADQFVRVGTTQSRCENCRANYKTYEYYGKFLCSRCKDEAEFKRRLEIRQKHSKWLLIYELTTEFDTYQEYIGLRLMLPPWVREQDLVDYEISLGRILTYEELEKYVREWREANEPRN